MSNTTAIHLLKVKIREHENNVWILFKVGNKATWRRSGVLVIIFEQIYTLFWCFHCYPWTRKYWLGQLTTWLKH